MATSVGRWVWRHKRAIATGTFLAAAGYSAYVVWRKKRELEQLLESVGLDQLLAGGGSSSARGSREARVREHFASTQREADRLLNDALPRLHEQLNALYDVDGFKRQMKADGAMADMGRWHELMVLVVAKLLTAQYALTLTSLHLRVKLNIVARHYLLEVAAQQDGTLGCTLTNLTKRRFLSTEHLLAEGLQPLAAAVSACVRAHFGAGGLSAQRLAERLTTDQVLALVAPIRAVLEADLDSSASDANGAAAAGNSNGRRNGSSAVAAQASRGAVARFLLDEMAASYGVVPAGDQLHALLGETRDALDSAVFRLTAADLLTSSFATLTTELQMHMEGGEATHLASRSLPFAKLLAQLHKVAGATLQMSEPFVDALVATPSLDEFCWLAYSGE